MPSLLDLPDDVFIHIGTYFEHDIKNLKPFLLVHPRIYAACNFLRYRSRTLLIDSESPLQDYLTHISWLQHVQSVEINVAFTKTKPGEIYMGRMGSSLRDPEGYDSQLALFILSLSQIRHVCLRTSSKLQGLRDTEIFPMTKTCEAVRKHTEIENLRIAGFSSESALVSALKVAQNLPNCSILETGQTEPRTMRFNIVIPLAEYLSTPAVAARLIGLKLVNLDFSSAGLEDAIQPIPLLPALEHLTLNIDTTRDQESIAGAAFFLAELLKRAPAIRSLVMPGDLLPQVTVPDVPFTFKRLHLQYSMKSMNVTEGIRWHGVYPSVELLTISGMSASLSAWNVMTGDVNAPSYPFPNLRRLKLVDRFNLRRQKAVYATAESQPFSILYVIDAGTRAENENRFINPVNVDKWLPLAHKLLLAPDPPEHPTSTSRKGTGLRSFL